MSEYIFKVTKVATEVHKPLQLLSNHCFCYQQKKLLTEVNLTVDLPFINDGYYKVFPPKKVLCEMPLGRSFFPRAIHYPCTYQRVSVVFKKM